MKIRHTGIPSKSGFSLVEAIFTIAIIGIMSGIVIAAISNASRDASRIVARQQQATLQSALNGWVMSQTRDPATGRLIGLEEIRTTYNAAGTDAARLQLFVTDAIGQVSYLDDASTDEFLTHTTAADKIQTEALISAKQFLTLPNWVNGEFPKVLLMDL